jgi:YD repeat-containing protein
MKMRDRGPGAGMLLAICSIAFANAADAGETVTYRYDSLGRLVRVERSGTVNNGVSARYSYDPADNRTRVTVATAGSPSAPSVAGGGFEAPDMGSGYVYRPAGSPATFSGNSGIAGNGSAWGFAAAPDGDQVAFLQGGDGPAVISLPVTGLTPGASYAASFRISARPGFSGIRVTVAFNGIALGSFDPATASFASATTAPFTAAASSGTLTFTANGASIYYASGIDLVTVAAAGSN